MKNPKIKRLSFSILSIIVLVIIDQLTKIWAVNHLENKEPIPIIGHALEFYYLPNGNTGAAFGMLQGHQMLFLLIASVISLIMLFFIYNMPEDKKYRSLTVIMTFIVAGGIGNMIDRLMLNFVIDFIYIRIINFPIFNVADMYVSVSTTILVLLFIFYYKEDDMAIIENAIKNVVKKNK